MAKSSYWVVGRSGDGRIILLHGPFRTAEEARERKSHIHGGGPGQKRLTIVHTSMRPEDME